VAEPAIRPQSAFLAQVAAIFALPNDQAFSGGSIERSSMTRPLQRLVGRLSAAGTKRTGRHD